MPKVFRPKITQTTLRSAPKGPEVHSSISDVPRSPSPVGSSHVTEPILVQTNPETPITPVKAVAPELVNPVSSSAPCVDIDQMIPAKPLTPVPDIKVDLFSTKKAKRIQTKNFTESIPDPSKPLDRSSVSLRSLLNWIPVNKPPPTYRQNRVNDSSTSVACSTQIVNNDPPPLKPILTATDSQSDMLAPQLRLDADGNIVLDEASLLVQIPETTTDTSGIRFVNEESGLLSVTYNSFRSLPEKSGGRWNARETVRFYRALSTIGPDFYLMTKLFPNRNRGELKRKFKRESRNHPYLVNQALRNRRAYDLTALVALSDEEDEEEEKEVKGDVDVKPFVKRKRRTVQSSTDKVLKAEKACNSYNADKVLETIDAVLGQSNDNDSDTNASIPATNSPRSSGKTTRLLDRMIAHKQREVELREEL